MSKGKVGEREVAKLVAPWWQKFEPSAEFASTPGSGGWRTSRVIRSDMRLAGDLMTNANHFPFTIEVKRRENWKERILRAGRKSPVWAWWRQTQEDADDEKGVPMLWFRQNRRPWFVMLPVGYVFERGMHNDLSVEMAWKASTFVKQGKKLVDYGASFPVVFLAKTLLESDPSRYAAARKVK